MRQPDGYLGWVYRPYLTDEAAGWRQVASPAGRAGWVAATDLRPLADLPGGEQARRETIVERGGHFVGVPYFGGGTSALGIDCSGLAQLLHRLVRITVPRDADQQFDAGRPV